jgi:allantoate deiminase
LEPCAVASARGPRLLIGSHLDSVVDGGNYDGPLGVITGILAVAHFCGKPPLPIDVLAFGDEEGSRFPSTLSSSAACVGAFEPETLELADRNGVSFADALKAYRKNPADIPKAAYRRGEALGSKDRGWKPRTSRSAWSPAPSDKAAGGLS